jgi:hypothetical protein
MRSFFTRILGAEAKARTPASTSGRHSVRPGVEALEDRLVMNSSFLQQPLLFPITLGERSALTRAVFHHRPSHVLDYQAAWHLDLSFLNLVYQVRDLMNSERAKVGVAPLTIEPHLEAEVWVYARTLSQLDYGNNSTHHEDGGATDNDGVALHIQRSGYPGHQWAENIADGQTSAQQVMYGPGWSWMNSPPHRANILSPNYQDLGVGFMVSKSGVLYWVAEFGGN